MVVTAGVYADIKPMPSDKDAAAGGSQKTSRATWGVRVIVCRRK